MDLPYETCGAERDGVVDTDGGAALMMVESTRRVVVNATNVEHDVGAAILSLSRVRTSQ